MNGIVVTLLCGLGLLVVYALVSGRAGMQKEFRDKQQGLADLLRYAIPVEDGIMLGKGGELMAGFFYRGSDTESSSNAELERVVSRLNQAFLRLGNGWMLHMDALRDAAIGYPQGGHFYHPTLRLIDAERRIHYEQEGAHYESVYAVVLTYQPPSRLQSKFKSMLFERSADLIARSKSIHDQVLDSFRTRLVDFEAQLGASVQGISRMRCESASTTQGTVTYDVLMAYLHYCVTGLRQQMRALDAQAIRSYADTIIGSQDFVGGNTPKIGKKHIRIVAIDGFPPASHPAILDALNKLPVTYRWSTRFIVLDKNEGRSLIESIRKKWKQKVRGMKDQMMNTSSGSVDEHAAAMTKDANTAKSEIESDVVRYGHYTSVVVLMDDDHERVDEAALQAAEAVRSAGFTARFETINAVEAYLGSLPGHGHENVRRPVVHTGNLAHMVPTTATWPGPRHNQCPFYPPNSPVLFYADTTGNAPFRGTLHVGDVGHTLVVGPTGSGKSTLLEFLEAQHFRYARARVVKFEKGYSSFPLCNAVGGAYFDIGHEESNIGFCPLARIDRANERKWAEGYVEMLLELQGVIVDSGKRSTIRAALALLARSDPDRRTLTDLTGAVQNLEMRQALEFYTLAGNNEILDATSDNIAFSRFTVFELEHLMSMGEKHVVPVLMYLFRCVERLLDGNPTLLVLDEAWLMLSHPMFQEKIKEWLKTLRKANCAVVFATQSLEDVAKSPIRDTVFTSCPTKILLPNENALNGTSLALYQELGLNEQQIEVIAAAIPKQDYYYMSPLGRRKFRLTLGPMALSLVGASGKEDVAEIRSLIKEHGEGWVAEWLRHCALHKAWGDGLREWANALQREMKLAA